MTGWLTNWPSDRDLFNPDPACPRCQSVQWVEPDTSTFHTHICHRCWTLFTPGNTRPEWAKTAADIYKQATTPREARPQPPSRPPSDLCMTCGQGHARCPEVRPITSGPRPTPIREFNERRKREQQAIAKARRLLAERPA